MLEQDSIAVAGGYHRGPWTPLAARSLRCCRPTSGQVQLCHFDATRHNLLARRSADGGDETVAIDWAFIGTGAIGEEINLLIPSPFFRFEADMGEAERHERVVFDGYLQGLRDAGWRGDWKTVRFGYTASAALRTAFIAPMLDCIGDEARRAEEERRWGRPIEQIMAQRGR